MYSLTSLIAYLEPVTEENEKEMLKKRLEQLEATKKRLEELKE